jgi:hypothetical protein
VHQTFRASSLLRAALVLAFLVAPLKSWSFRHAEDAIWLHTLTATGVACAFFAWPRAIHFDQDGIWQRSLFGRVTRIRLKEVDSLSQLADEGKTVVGGPQH